MTLPAAVDAIWAEMDVVGRAVLAELRPLSQAQADWRPAEGEWSIGQIVNHLTDRVIPLTTFYDAMPTLVGARLRNVPTSVASGTTNTWNAHEWDII